MIRRAAGTIREATFFGGGDGAVVSVSGDKSFGYKAIGSDLGTDTNVSDFILDFMQPMRYDFV